MEENNNNEDALNENVTDKVEQPENTKIELKKIQEAPGQPDPDMEIYRMIEERPKAKPMGFFTRFISIFISPFKLMENIKDNISIVQPMIMIAIFIAIGTIFYGDYEKILLKEFEDFNAEKYEAYLNQAQQLRNEGNSIAILITASLLIFISFIVVGLIKALIFWIISKILKGEGKYLQYYSMCLHINVIYSLGLVLTYFFSVMLNTSTNILTLEAILSPSSDITSLYHILFSSIGIIGIWAAALYAVGFKVFNGFSTLKSIIISVCLFVFITAFWVSSEFLQSNV